MEQTIKAGDIVYLDNNPYKAIRANKFGVKLRKEGRNWYSHNELRKVPELNLCELLKGCEGETFYTPACGIIRFIKFDGDDLQFQGFAPVHFTKSGKLFSNHLCDGSARCLLYPSRALYEKYPLDPYSAWMEWKESRKPKRWRAKEGEEYWYFDAYLGVFSRTETSEGHNEHYFNGNYFRTEEEAQQAAEGVREYLQKFHEKNSKK